MFYNFNGKSIFSQALWCYLLINQIRLVLWSVYIKEIISFYSIFMRECHWKTMRELWFRCLLQVPQKQKRCCMSSLQCTSPFINFIITCIAESVAIRRLMILFTCIDCNCGCSTYHCCEKKASMSFESTQKKSQQRRGHIQFNKRGVTGMVAKLLFSFSVMFNSIIFWVLYLLNDISFTDTGWCLLFWELVYEESLIHWKFHVHCFRNQNKASW